MSFFQRDDEWAVERQRNLQNSVPSRDQMETAVQQDDTLTDFIPTDKLKAPTKLKEGVTPLVIFYNGTFAPVHAGHLNALQTAFDYFNSANYEVIGAYMSPCWSGYANRKLQEQR